MFVLAPLTSDRGVLHHHERKGSTPPCCPATAYTERIHVHPTPSGHLGAYRGRLHNTVVMCPFLHGHIDISYSSCAQRSAFGPRNWPDHTSPRRAPPKLLSCWTLPSDVLWRMAIASSYCARPSLLRPFPSVTQPPSCSAATTIPSTPPTSLSKSCRLAGRPRNLRPPGLPCSIKPL